VTARTWPLRRRPERLGKHRALPTITETPLPASTAASLPQPQIAIATVAEADPEPDTIVECGFCHVTGPSSLIPENAGVRRCVPDIDGCVQRSLQEGRPRPLLSSAELLAAAAPAEALTPLPPAQEQALAAFNEAHDEHDAETLSEDEEPTPPSDAEEAQAEIRREAIEALRGPLAEPEPQDGGEAE
jgi:hypothetical protein